ncbi:MAG: hypothetical protein ABFD91_09150 [Anaerohalosphaeraceae bacterium]
MVQDNDQIDNLDEESDQDGLSDREMGPQPVAALMEKHKLKPHDLVAVSKLQLTHKMVSRACKGRKLSRRVQFKVLYALNEVAQQDYKLRDLFTY